MIGIAIARCHFPVRSLGHGVRTGIWLQGCSIHCPGCIVPETWEATPAHQVELPALVAAVQAWVERSDGVTISGGEPFDQPLALHALLTALRTLSTGDLLVYSGYPWRKLYREHPDILALCDVVVAEPFRSHLMAITPLTGSSNQAVQLLTPLARERYRDWRDFSPAVGLALGDGALHLTGIMPRAKVAAVAENLSQGEWRARLTHGSL